MEPEKPLLSWKEACLRTIHMPAILHLPRTQTTVVLIEKGLVLSGWPSKIEVSWVLGTYSIHIHFIQWAQDVFFRERKNILRKQFPKTNHHGFLPSPPSSSTPFLDPHGNDLGNRQIRAMPPVPKIQDTNLSLKSTMLTLYKFVLPKQIAFKKTFDSSFPGKKICWNKVV